MKKILLCLCLFWVACNSSTEPEVCDGIVDECGVCNGDGIADDACDCDGNVEDCAGECDGDAVVDCNGECDGDAVVDCNGECDGDAVVDCNGECDGDAVIDECGECDGDGIADDACDCDGNVVDECGECGGDGSSCITELEGSWTGSIINQGFPENQFTFTFNGINCGLIGFITDSVYTEDGEWVDLDIPVTGTTIFTTNTEVEPSQVDVTIISYIIGGQPVEEYEGLTALGIYEIEGDTLKFAGAEPGTPERPLGFSGDEEGMQVYILFKD